MRARCTADASQRFLLSRRTVLRLVGPTLIGSSLLTNTTCAIALESSEAAQKRVAGESAVAWLNDRHDGLTRKGTLILDVTKSLEEALEADENISVTIGRDLTKQKRAYQIWIFSNNFFVFPLTNEQEKGIGIEEDDVTTWHGARKDTTVSPLAAELQALEISDAERLSGSGKISGSVRCKKLADISADFSFRLTYHTEAYTRRSYIYLSKNQAPLQDVIDFSFGKINRETEKDKHLGPLAMFAEICTAGKDQQKDTLYSNTVATMVNVVA
jgi:hypothetical protein